MESSLQVRPITRADVAAFLALRIELDRESAFMMYEPGERSADLNEASAEVESLLATPLSPEQRPLAENIRRTSQELAAGLEGLPNLPSSTSGQSRS